MSKMSVKKVTGVMILSLSFEVSAALMSPFGGVFAGKHGEVTQDTQDGGSEIATDDISENLYSVNQERGTPTDLDVGYVAESLGQNLSTEIGSFPLAPMENTPDGMMGNQAHNKNTKARKPLRSVELNKTAQDFRGNIAQILGSSYKRVKKDLVLFHAKKAVASLQEKGFSIRKITRDETRDIRLFYKNYTIYSYALLPEMMRSFIESQKTLDP